MKIDLIIPSMSEQTITQQFKGHIILHEDYLENVMEFYCSESKDDDPAIWEEDVLRSYNSIFLKKFITGTTVKRNHKEDKWMLTIWTTNTNLDTLFDKESDCREIGNKINNWLLNK